MNSQFTQPHKVVNVESNKQAIARDFGIKANQVGYLDTKKPVDDYFILYDRATQTSWFKRSAAKGNPISWSISGSTLTLTMPDAVFTLRQAINVNTVDLLDGDLGAHMVGIKAKFAGAIARTQADKNAETVSVEDYGAIGDGVHDDTAAFNLALATGALEVTNTKEHKKYYRITDSLLMKTDHQTLNLNNSEINMDDPTGLKSHLIMAKDSVQGYAMKVEKTVFTNSYTSSVAQIQIKNIGAPVVQDCVGYGANKAKHFISITRCIVAYIRRNTTEALLDTAVVAVGIGPDADRAVDVAIYDNRFIGGKHAVRYGEWAEGLFCRRNIFYAQTSWALLMDPATKDQALFSAKIQDNDFDSPQTADGSIYMQYFANVQILDNWYANNSTDPMIRLESTDSVIISGGQAYPFRTWLSDNGVNTTVSGSLVVGGTTHVLYGPLADMSSLMANHFNGASNYCVNANAHVKNLAIISNYFKGAAGGIATSQDIATHTFVGNVGDTASGTTTSVHVGDESPVTLTVGPRPESISLRKASGITSISVNNTEVYNSTDSSTPSSFIGLGVLPPGTTFIITFNPANGPWLNRIKN